MSNTPLAGRTAADAFPLRGGALPPAFDRNLTYVVLAALGNLLDRRQGAERLALADALYDAALDWARLIADPVQAAAFAGALARAALRLHRRRQGQSWTRLQKRK